MPPCGERHGHGIAGLQVVVPGLAVRHQDLVLGRAMPSKRPVGHVEVHDPVEALGRDARQVLLVAVQPDLAEAQRHHVTRPRAGRARSPPSSGLMLDPEPLMTASARSPSSMPVRSDALADAVKIATSDTRPSPITSAAAVDDVRRGLRAALPRASVPVTPSAAGSGPPEDPGQRPGQHRTHRDQAEEHDEDAEERHRDRAFLAEPAVDPVPGDREPGRRDHDAGDRAPDERSGADVALHVADRRDRRDAGGPQRRVERGGGRDADADHERRDDRAADHDQAGVRNGQPERREHVEQHAGEPDAEPEPDQRSRPDRR